MARKVITFLGINPKEAVYRWKGKEYCGRVFPEALRQFVEFDKMLVFATARAQAESYPFLEALGDSRIECVPIVEGEDAEGIWEIFRQVTERVEEKETVIFDVTHGLRSIPFLVFLFVAYLKAAKQVTIEAVYYGALDMKRDGVAPVIDLSEFVQMLDWLTATEQFIQTGNARQLVALLRSDKLRRERVFKKVARVLDQVSQAAFLCQPFALMKEVAELRPALREAEEHISKMLPPFHLLAEQICEEFEPFRADFPHDPRETLRAEYRLIRWYVEKSQLIQAMSLAREFIIDGVQYKFSKELSPASFERVARSEFERAVSGLRKVGGPNPEGGGKFTVDCLNEYGRKIYCNDEGNWPENDWIKKAWSQLEEIRNRLDHAEHQTSSIPPDTLQRKAQQDVLPALEKLAEAWGLVEAGIS